MSTPRRSNPSMEMITISEIIPYWRNPKNHTPEGVEALAKSIETYGFQQPIVLDKKKTIIAGHKRYAAVKHLGWTEVPCIIADISEKKAKEYRIIDNKSGEDSAWTSDLELELREFSTPGMLETFFPDLALGEDWGNMKGYDVTQEQVDRVTQQLADRFTEHDKGRQSEPVIEIPCPDCGSISRIPVRDLMNDLNWVE